MPGRTRARTDSSRRRSDGAGWRGIRPWIAVAITAAVILATYLALTFPQDSQDTVPGTEEFDYGETIIQGPLRYTPVFNSCTDDYRPDYGADCDTLRTVFGDLPKVPADMIDVSDRVFRNAQGFVTLGRIPNTYWQNPEFYPGWSQAHFEDVYTRDRGDIVTPIGFGAYPSITQIVSKQQTDKWTFSFFLKDGWGITHWQGMVLDIEIPRVALKANFQEPLLDDSDAQVTQDPATASLMNPTFTFDNDPVYESFVQDLLVPLEDSERMVVLEPNQRAFSPGWVQVITVEVNLSALPPGTWFFLVKANIPSQEIGELYFYEYGHFYQPSGFGMVLFEGILVVV
ncbi:MAG: hypothetical protein ACE5HJ_07165 [Thermoplasmata archaeon]